MLRSPRETDDIEITDPDLQGFPKIKNQMIFTKRKASDILKQGSFSITYSFLNWKLAVVESQLEIRIVQKHTLQKSNSSNKTVKINIMKVDEKAFLKGKAFFLTQRKVFEKNLYGTVINKNQLT